ncbi:MAG TPA: enolase C-terminal domain-like protein, partial [Myxococcaceae bacterium]|nr:enolase C-terminal domain-like protein [Myxococcaceae bacterium]
MRVVNVSVAPFRQALRAPLRTARGGIAERSGFWVRLGLEGGGEGLGEAMPLPTAGTEEADECERLLCRAGQVLTGQQVPEVLVALAVTLDAQLGLADAPAARHAVEGALLDAWARARGQSISSLFSRRPASSVRLSALLSSEAPEALSEEAQSLAAVGFRTLKLKVGALSLNEDLARVSAVASAAPDASLRLDANRAWTLAEASQALPLLFEGAQGRASLCEDPLRELAPDAWAALRARQPIPLAVDEPLADVRVRQQFLARPDAFDAWVLKPLVQGGLWRSWALAGAVRTAGKGVVVTSSLDGAVARAAAAQLCAALPESLDAGLYTGRLFADEALRDPLVAHDGALDLGGVLGHGVAWGGT